MGTSLESYVLIWTADASEEEWRREQAHLGWPLRTVAFFATTIGFGIPAMMAYRRFVDEGYRRKAHEWIEWGFFSFVFHRILCCAFQYVI